MGNCGCANNNNCFGGLFNNGGQQTWIWILILLLIFCSCNNCGGCWNGCGCD